jgi:hypothetical protein
MNDDGWMEHNFGKHLEGFFKESQKRNLVQSKYVLILPATKNPDDPPLIFLRSWGYASNPERLHIIGLQSSGDPLLVFNDELALVDFSDVDGDGAREIIGYPCLSEGVSKHVGSYHPYQVFKIESPIQKAAVLSIPLTEQYTKQKYDGWAGPDCSDEYVIIWSEEKDKKPLVVSKEEFEEMEKAPPPAH